MKTNNINRNKNNKTHRLSFKVISAALAASMILSFSACGSSDSKSSKDNAQAEAAGDNKTYTHDGLSITLPDSFKASEQDTYTFYYTSNDAICLGLKESKETINAAQLAVATLDDYAGVVMKNSEITSELTDYSDTAKYFTWDKKVNDTEYSYIGFVTETADSFWLVQFASLKNTFEESKKNFFTYFDSVKFQ